MMVRVVSEISAVSGVIPVGQIINIPPAVFHRLGGQVVPLQDGRNLPHYCTTAGGWCSGKLTGVCSRDPCEHFATKPAD